MYRLVYILLLALCLISCNPISDARKTLVEADSLRSVGVLYGDSSTIAKTAATYGRWPVYSIYPAEYAKANYYYGRLLLERNHHSDAMTCFINASHTDPQMPWFKRVGATFRTVSPQEYSLLGNTYCNIGTICHLAGDFQLSYDIFSLSAEKFKQANNTTAYFYALNDMAYESAELKQKDQTLFLLNAIETSCTDSAVSAQINLTKAELFYKVCQYDSAIYFADRFISVYPNLTFGYVVKAQALWFSGHVDSALCLANYIVTMPHVSYSEQFNMLYILTYNDSSLDSEHVKALSEKRSDIHIQKLVPIKLQATKAIQLLLNDRDKKYTNRNWILLLFILIFSSILIVFCVFKIRRWKTAQINIIEQKRHIVDALTQKKKQELDDATKHAKHEQLQIILQNFELKEENKLLEQTLSQREENLLQQLETNCQALRLSSNIKDELSWSNYELMCQTVNKNLFMFVNKLKALYVLSERETRLCILVLIGGFSSKQLAELLFYSETGIRNLKSNTAKKIGCNSKNFRSSLAKIAVFGRLS